MTVVGVVKDVREDLDNYRINRPVWYVPYAQTENDFPVNLVMRAAVDPTSLTAEVRDAVRRVDPDQPVSDIMTMNTNLSGILVTERFGAVLMAALAVSGLLVASIGLYGVMAYSVNRRTSEIGLRVALGARPRHVLQLIIGQGMKLTGMGVAIGLAVAWTTTRLLAGLLFGLSATDIGTFTAIAVMLGVVGLVACYFPARSAMRLNPAEALRYE